MIISEISEIKRRVIVCSKTFERNEGIDKIVSRITRILVLTDYTDFSLMAFQKKSVLVSEISEIKFEVSSVLIREIVIQFAQKHFFVSHRVHLVVI